MSQIRPEKERTAYYDVLKGIAMCLVLYNHTYAFSLYQTATAFSSRILHLSMVTLTAMNWPLFFMISGALLFDREESIRDIFLKRILRMGGVLLVYQVIIMLINVWRYDKNYTIWQWVYGIITNSYDGAYQSTWYLYAYLGFLIMLPLLKLISVRIKSDEFIYLLVVIFLYHCILPITTALLNWKCNLALSLSTDFRLPLLVARESMYPIVGYYINWKINIKNTRKCKMIGAALFVIMILLCVLMEYFAVYSHGQTTYPYSAMFTVFLAGYVFWIVKDYFKSHDIGIVTGILRIIGQHSFGIYLMAPVMQTLLYNRYHVITTKIMPIWTSSVLWCCITIVVCLSITILLKKIPVFKAIL